MSDTWVTFLFEAANFLLLAVVLGWLFFRPIRDMLERRRSEFENERLAAADTRAEAKLQLEQARSRRTELEAALETLRERVQRAAETESERLIETARGQMQRERETLKGELASHRRAQARSLARDAALVAREIVVRLLGEIEGPDLERSLLRAACGELEKLRASGSLAPVVVEAASPLDDDALHTLLEAAGIGTSGTVHRSNPDLVAGLRVLTSRGLVDASVAGMAAQAERVLLSELERENTNYG